MPRKTKLALTVSQTAPLLVVFGSDQPGAWFWLDYLRQQGNLRLGVVSENEPPFAAENLQLSRQAGNWPANYVVSFGWQPAALDLARKNQARFLLLIGPGENLQQYQRELKTLSLDWRLVQRGHLYGPNPFWQPKTNLDFLFLAAAFSCQPQLKKEQLIFPIFNQDFAHGLFLSLFSPLDDHQPLVLAGQPLSLGEVWSSLARQAQVFGRNRCQQKFRWGTIDPRLWRETRRRLDWQAAVPWPEGQRQTLQFLLQKLSRGELEHWRPQFKAKIRPKMAPVAKKVSLPPREKVVKKKKRSKKKTTVKPPAPIITVSEELIAPATRPRPPAEEEHLSKKPVARNLPTTPAKPEAKPPPEKKRFPSWPGRRYWGLLVILAWLLTLPFWVVSFTLARAGWHLWQGAQFYRQRHFEASLRAGRLAQLRAASAKVFLEHFHPAPFYLGSWHFFYLTADSFERGGRLLILGTQLNQQTEQLGNLVLGRATTVPDFNYLINLSQNLAYQLEMLQLDLAAGQNYWSGLQRRWQPRLQKNLDLLNFSLPVWRLMAWLVKEPRLNALLLLENSNELRPGGGFIGSLARLHFHHGQLVDFQVNDVYQADGHLEGHVEPPMPLRRYLGEGNWYLRDSNWSADFPTAAQAASWFLEKEMKEKPTLVVGVTLNAIQDLLAAIGPLKLPAIGEEISAANLFARAEFYAEKNSFPGSRQKANFLNLLGEQILAGFKNGRYGGKTVARALFKSLREKKIILWFADPKPAAICRQQNWDGAVVHLRPQKNTVNDYLYLVEANLGVNKANYFLRRSLALKIDPGDHFLRQQLEISYENNAQNQNWPGGDYKNYLRVFLPPKSQLESVRLLDETGQAITIADDDIQQKFAFGYQEIGLWFTVPVRSRRRLLLSYRLPLPPLGPRWQLAFYWQKQPGAGASPLTLLLNFPPAYQPLASNQPATVSEQSLLFSRQLDRDQFFRVTFAR